jgi:hypothetical protein
MAHGTLVDVFRPIRRKQPSIALRTGVFIVGACACRAIELLDHDSLLSHRSLGGGVEGVCGSPMTQVSLYADIHGFVVDRERIATMCVAALPKTRDKFYFLPASGAELRPMDGVRPKKHVHELMVWPRGGKAGAPSLLAVKDLLGS